MQTAEIIETSSGQTVRLPAEFRFKTRTVAIRRQGEAVILEPISSAEWPEHFLRTSGSRTPPSPVLVYEVAKIQYAAITNTAADLVNFAKSKMLNCRPPRLVAGLDIEGQQLLLQGFFRAPNKRGRDSYNSRAPSPFVRSSKHFTVYITIPRRQSCIWYS
jgi:virulence-associated protein VagC